MNKVREWIKPLEQALKKGMTIKEMSMTISIGAVLGLFPIFGTSTVLCIIAGWYLNLNMAVIQAVNLLMTPLAVAASVPFYKLGYMFFGGGSSWIQYILLAVVGWCIAAIPAYFLIKFLSVPLLKLLIKY